MVLLVTAAELVTLYTHKAGDSDSGGRGTEVLSIEDNDEEATIGNVNPRAVDV